MPSDVVELFQKHAVAEHGVVNVRAVINELSARKENPVAALNRVLDDVGAGDWHFYAAEGLRSLASQGTLDTGEGQKLLNATHDLYRQFGLDEYYKSIAALAASARTAPVLAEFVEQQLRLHTVRDWRWLAFFTAGTLLRQEPRVITRRLAEQLPREAAAESDPRRRSQMLDVATRCLALTTETARPARSRAHLYQTDQYEGMIAETVSMNGANGEPILAYAAWPLGPGPFPGMVILHHEAGWDEWHRECARRFAHHGYVAICPDLYFREGHGTPEDVAGKVRATGGIPDSRVLGDVDGAIGWLRALPFVGAKLGVFGTSSGGRRAFLAGCRLRGLAAVIDCWGNQVVVSRDHLTPNQPVAPIDYTEDLSCPILGIFGNEDKSPTPDEVFKHEAQLKKHAKVYEFHRYDGAGHGFFLYDRPGYRVEQAMDGWRKIWAFCERTLS